MNIKQYKAGRYVQQYQYKSFLPSTINHDWIWEDPKINTLLEKATKALGELNAFSLIVPDVDLFIHMHIFKEASTSSRIEGTQTHIDEALRSKEQIEPERRDDWQEVQNYVQAMKKAIEALETLPLSNRLLCDTHRILLQGVRGEQKLPGEFRLSQNWIGGTSIVDAAFIPPSHEEIPNLMSDLEKFWHNETIEVPHLVRIAISHYQFETIHPFLDGNGRIGRLLITLYLVGQGLLAKPSLYLSSYIEKRKIAYYEGLTTVRATHDIGHWIRFFLLAVLETANQGVATFRKILDLRSSVEPEILRLGKKAVRAKDLLNFLYKKPVVSPNEVAQTLSVTHQTANRLINDFVELEILQERTGFQRNRVFQFDRYLRLFLD
ncbi:Fic family protein [Nitrospira sp. Ecomares 2.1]